MSFLREMLSMIPLESLSDAFYLSPWLPDWNMAFQHSFHGHFSSSLRFTERGVASPVVLKEAWIVHPTQANSIDNS